MNTINRGQTELYSQYGGGAGGPGIYEEPRVDILASSRRDQLADALGQSANKQQNSQMLGMHDYGSGVSEGEISPDGLLVR